jgi:hypothetical protein
MFITFDTDGACNDCVAKRFADLIHHLSNTEAIRPVIFWLAWHQRAICGDGGEAGSCALWSRAGGVKCRFDLPPIFAHFQPKRLENSRRMASLAD